MLQRIQTIYLFAGLLFAGLLFYFPLWNSGDSAGLVTYGAGSHLVLFVINILISIFIIISIFLFRKRKWQITFCWITILITSGFISLFFIFFIQDTQGMTGFISGLKWAAFFPVIIIVFAFLAMKNIRKDEELIRSMNRLR